jgi:hypothetical protein
LAPLTARHTPYAHASKQACNVHRKTRSYPGAGAPDHRRLEGGLQHPAAAQRLAAAATNCLRSDYISLAVLLIFVGHTTGSRSPRVPTRGAGHSSPTSRSILALPELLLTILPTVSISDSIPESSWTTSCCFSLRIPHTRVRRVTLSVRRHSVHGQISGEAMRCSATRLRHFSDILSTLRP